MRSDLLAAVGARIRQFREASGVSQEKFAAISGFDRAYVGRIERGTQNISLMTLSRIADALDVPMTDILVGMDAPDTAPPAD